jgi:hypothetical protein
MHKLRTLLLGDDRSRAAQVRVAMLVAAISGAVMHPFVIDLPDDVLRSELTHLAPRWLD